MPSRSPLATVATLLLVLLAGCSQSTQGTPSPGDQPATETNGETSDGTTVTEETPTSEAPSGVADLQPCDLLDQTALQGLRLTGGDELELGGARVCEYRYEGATLNESFTVSVALWDNQGIGNLNAQNIEELPDIGSHKAVSFVDAAGACGIGLGVGDSSRVDSSAVGGDQQQGCQLAEQVAIFVERELP